MSDLIILKGKEKRFKIKFKEVNFDEFEKNKREEFSFNYLLDSNKNIVKITINGLLHHNHDFSFLNKFKQLEELNLRYNNINEINFIHTLFKINTLDLSYNKITTIENLNTLLELSYLNLSNNDISSIQNLESLLHIQYLHLSNNNISVIKNLENLENLWELNLSQNKISVLSKLNHNTNLRVLDLSNNYIRKIVDIEKLTSLVILELDNNFIKNLENLDCLNNLKFLTLNNNSINRIKNIRNLQSLEYLNLSYNKILKIENLENLLRLDSLILNYNKILKIENLESINRLVRIELSDNSISKIENLEKLKELQFIELSNNYITSIESLDTLNEGAFIDVSFNQLITFPKKIAKLNYDIELNYSTITNDGISRLSIIDNPFLNPPLKIIEQGNEAIIRYWDRLAKEKESYIYEAKLTIVGGGGAGKTSLSNRLINEISDLPKEDTRTRGIEIEEWKFDSENKNCIAHIWDFGGQDVYFPVHRFFLTEGSVFILVASTRNNEHNFDYWIPTIHQFGKDSPIVITQNCFDGVDSNWNDITTYSGNVNFNIVKTQSIPFYRFNLPKENEGLSEIKNVVIDQIKGLKNFGEKVTETWVKLRSKIAELKDKNIISYAEFEKEYKKLDVNHLYSEEDIKDSALFFHNLGLILWYHENKELEDTVILNPEWALNAVYKVIDDKEIKKGRVTKEDFKRIWNDTDIRDHKRVLRHMLESFKIAFPLKDNPSTYIIPVLQSPITKEETWNENDNCLRIKNVYDFMPKGMVNQLSAELSKNTREDEIWNNAVNFYLSDKSDTKCQVIEDLRKRTITIKAYGSDSVKISSIVQHSLDSIVKAYRGVKPEIFIPCICTECKNKGDGELFKYSKLLNKLEEKGLERAKMTCNDSDDSMLIFDLLNNTGFDKVLEKYKRKHEEELLRTKKIDEMIEVSAKTNDYLAYLEKESKSNIKAEDIENIIGVLSRSKQKSIYNETLEMIKIGFQLQEENLDKKLKELYHDLQNKDITNLDARLKLSIPFLDQLGIDAGIEGSFDIKSWGKKMYKKYELEIFKKMGYL